MQVDTFKTQTFDGFPVEVECVVGSDEAKVTIPGFIKWRVSVTLPKNKALNLYNNVSVFTHKEVYKILFK